MMETLLWPLHVAADVFGIGSVPGSIPFLIGRHRMGAILSPAWLSVETTTFGACEGGMCGAPQGLALENLEDVGTSEIPLLWDMGPGGYHERRTLTLSEDTKNEQGDCYFPSNIGTTVINFQIKFHNKFDKHNTVKVAEIDQNMVATSYFLGVLGILGTMLLFGFVSFSHMGRIPLHWASWALHVGIPLNFAFIIACLGTYVSSNATDQVCPALDKESTKHCSYGGGIVVGIIAAVLIGIALVLAFALVKIDAGRGQSMKYAEFSEGPEASETTALHSTVPTGASSSSDSGAYNTVGS